MKMWQNLHWKPIYSWSPQISSSEYMYVLLLSFEILIDQLRRLFNLYLDNSHNRLEYQYT